MIGIGIGLMRKGGGGEATGPILNTAPALDMGYARNGETITRTQGSYSARGGGSVTITTSEFRVDNVQVATGASYTPDGADEGLVLTYVETATETGGTADGTRTTTISLGAVLAITAPAAFADANWSVATGTGNATLDVTIASLPDNGGSAITDVEYDVDGGGTWTSLPAYAGTGSYAISMAAGETSYGIRLRAVNAIGNAPAGNTESATSSAASLVTGRSAVLMLAVGQSLAANRGTILQGAPGAAVTTAKMAVGGACQTGFAFFSGNPLHTPLASEWASLANFAESGTQSPLAGVTNTLTGYDLGVFHSAAIGGRTLGELHGAFAQVAAAIERGIDLIVAEGKTRDDIDVIFMIKHGEADGFVGTSQAAYEELFANYVFRCRLAVKQALRDASYNATFHMTFPIQQNRGDDDRAIKKALLAQADVLGGVYIGEMWSVDVETDRVHPDAAGYIYGGERFGHQISNDYQALRCTSFTGSGTAWTATFSKDVVQDTSLGLAGSLNGANAMDGLEVWDQGAAGYIKINSLNYSGNTIGVTLNSAPVGTPELRIAVQDTTSTLTANNAEHVGCAVRSTTAGWASVYNPSYTHYDWCIPQTVEAS